MKIYKNLLILLSYISMSSFSYASYTTLPQTLSEHRDLLGTILLTQTERIKQLRLANVCFITDTGDCQGNKFSNSDDLDPVSPPPPVSSGSSSGSLSSGSSSSSSSSGGNTSSSSSSSSSGGGSDLTCNNAPDGTIIKRSSGNINGEIYCCAKQKFAIRVSGVNIWMAGSKSFLPQGNTEEDIDSYLGKLSNICSTISWRLPSQDEALSLHQLADNLTGFANAVRASGLTQNKIWTSTKAANGNRYWVDLSTGSSYASTTVRPYTMGVF